MVFVMLARSNLREEFAMVDDVFALSPISARSAQPSEADYEAIRDAFMETSRGRWFLGEYAKRNRNADTSMVLDAVARIEHALAAQRHLHQQAEANALPEALAAIRSAVADAAQATATALDGLAIQQNLAPVRKGTRIIKEISWRWREIGADSRICDLLDSQVIAIEAACDQLANADPHAVLGAAFDIIRARLNEFDGVEAAVASATDEIVRPSAAEAVETAVASEAATTESGAKAVAQPAETTSPPVEASAAPVPVETAVAAVERIGPASEVTAATQAIAVAAAEPAPEPIVNVAAADEIVGLAVADKIIAEISITTVVPVETAAVPPPVTSERAEIVAEPANAEAGAMADASLDLIELTEMPTAVSDAEAQDEAILELVAMEMSAPDPIEAKEFTRTTHNFDPDADEPVPVDDDIIATFPELTEPEPVVVTEAVVPPPPAPPPPAPEPRLAVAPAPEPAAALAPPPPPSAAAVIPEPPRQEAPRQEPPKQEPPKLEPQQEPLRPAAILHAVPKPSYEPSLGSTLLANGLLQRHQVSANDPLTPIRRMTQPEKIAFFS
jgi:hypothetical protein